MENLNIQEATKLSKKKQRPMYRASWAQLNKRIYPTNSIQFGCLQLTLNNELKDVSFINYRWEPSAKDLMANDWVV